MGGSDGCLHLVLQVESSASENETKHQRLHICFKDMENSILAAVRKKIRINDMMVGERDGPKCQISVMGLLSVMKMTLFPVHSEQHVRTAAAMAK